MHPKRRDKFVYFRISGEEFDQIVRACEASGARSLSDFARHAVHTFIKTSAVQSEPEMAESLERLQAVVSELKNSVQELTSAVVTCGHARNDSSSRINKGNHETSPFDV